MTIKRFILPTTGDITYLFFQFRGGDLVAAVYEVPAAKGKK